MENIILQRISYYEAPHTDTVIPVAIPESIECIELLTAGKVFFDMESERRTFSRGTVFWHRSGDFTIHRTDPQDPYRCIVFHFRTEASERRAPRVSLWKTPDTAVEFARDCMNCFHSGTNPPELLAQYAYTTLLWNARKRSAETAIPPLTEKLMNYIERNCVSPIDVDSIAAYAGISKPYLFALFREFLHTSPHRYLLKQRISHAKLMLANRKEIPIKEIGESCGFDSLEVFYRHFRAETGTTPAEYRRNYSPYDF